MPSIGEGGRKGVKRKSRSFTERYPTRVDTLESECLVSAPTSDWEPNGRQPERRRYNARWDTGSTKSGITQKVADDLHLPVTRCTEMFYAGSDEPVIVQCYRVNIELLSGVRFSHLEVGCSSIPAPDDVLIGMDIIGLGDFAVTNFNGRTQFSFRYPSGGWVRALISKLMKG